MHASYRALLGVEFVGHLGELPQRAVGERHQAGDRNQRFEMCRHEEQRLLRHGEVACPVVDQPITRGLVLAAATAAAAVAAAEVLFIATAAAARNRFHGPCNALRRTVVLSREIIVVLLRRGGHLVGNCDTPPFDIEIKGRWLPELFDRRRDAVPVLLRRRVGGRQRKSIGDK